MRLSRLNIGRLAPGGIIAGCFCTSGCRHYSVDYLFDWALGEIYVCKKSLMSEVAYGYLLNS
jgi:hypothetical protein